MNIINSGQSIFLNKGKINILNEEIKWNNKISIKIRAGRKQSLAMNIKHLKHWLH